MKKLLNNVTEFVSKLSEINTGARNQEFKKYKHIDIELIKEDEIKWIQITHCSFSDPYYFDWVDVLSNAVCQRTIENNDRLILVLFKSRAANYELIYDFSEVDPIPRISSIIHIPYLKQYLAIRIMHKLKKEEIKLFKTRLSQLLNDLNNIYLNLKYTFHCGEEFLYNTSVRMDEIFNNCKLLSSAMEKIIVSSTNNEVRQQCSQLLDTTQSGILSEIIFIKLLGLFNNNYEVQNNR